MVLYILVRRHESGSASHWNKKKTVTSTYKETVMRDTGTKNVRERCLKRRKPSFSDSSAAVATAWETDEWRRKNTNPALVQI